MSNRILISLATAALLGVLAGPALADDAPMTGGQTQGWPQQPDATGHVPMTPPAQPLGQMPLGPLPMEQQPMGQQPMGQVPMGQQPMGQMPMGQHPTAQQPMGQMPAATMEMQDWGVAPIQQLHTGAPHSPTPVSIPGARVVTTQELAAAMSGGQRPLLFDVLGGQAHETLPGAYWLPSAGGGQGFDDRIQQAMQQMLQQGTGGNRAAPLVFFCLGPECWLSYNAALRAVKLGYTNVAWYRGGLEAWAQNRLPMQPTTQPLW
jgi:PQQ-dependent catabolism-associated CXXCW motif protein